MIINKIISALFSELNVVRNNKTEVCAEKYKLSNTIL